MSTEEHGEGAEMGDQLVRAFPVEMESDGRTIDLRIVPYNKVARVADPPTFMPYDEMWMPGAFAKQLKAAHRVSVLLNFEHEQGLRGVIGHGVELRDAADGLHGTFRIHDNSDGNKALELVNEKILTGVSMEAPLRSVRSKRTGNGVMQRISAHLDKVALCRFDRPAYADAQVLAVREAPIIAQSFEPVPALSDATLARLDALGVAPLERVKVTSQPWDNTRERFTDEEYQRSCLVARDGECSLPVLEPDGSLNVNAMRHAADRLATVSRRADKSAAARKLVRYYRIASMDPPASVTVTART